MKKLNQKGSTIVAAVTIILLVLVTIGVALGIATSYQKRSINEHSRKQAYLTGLSVAQGIAGQIGNNISLDQYVPASKETQINFEVTALPDNAGGNVSVQILLDQNDVELLYIRVTSVYNQITQEVQLTMQFRNNKWYTKVYSEIGDEFNDQK